MLGFGKKKNLLESAPQLSLPDLIRRTRIVVIDDIETEFPFKILRDQGYAIDYWPDVKDLGSLERGDYDIIVLDIGGIGRELDPVNEGAGVLKHLKRINPSQIIVAYSGQSHDMKRMPFFKEADEYVPKPNTALDWKATLDNLIKSKVTVEHYWATILHLLRQAGRTPAEIDRYERQLIKAMEDRDATKAKTLTLAMSVASNSLTIGAVIAKLIALMMH